MFAIEINRIFRTNDPMCALLLRAVGRSENPGVPVVIKWA